MPKSEYVRLNPFFCVSLRLRIKEELKKLHLSKDPEFKRMFAKPQNDESLELFLTEPLGRDSLIGTASNRRHPKLSSEAVSPAKRCSTQSNMRS